VAEADVIAPVRLVVANPDASEALQRQVAQEVPFVVRHAPQVLGEREAMLRKRIDGARRNFLTHVRRADFESGSFARVINEISGRSPREMPFEQLAPLWARGASDAAIIERLLQPLREVMAKPIVRNKTDVPLPLEGSVQLLPTQSLIEAPTARELEHPGQVIPAAKVITLWRARRLVETYFSAGEESMARFTASFIQINAVPDPATTELLRARRTEGVAVNETFEAAQVIVRKGQTIDRKALNALSMMREKSLIGALQTRLEQEQTLAGQIKGQTRLIAASLGLVCVVMVLILWRLRPRPSTALVALPANPSFSGPEANALPSGEKDESWRTRALVAEGKAARAQQAIRSGAMGWLREKIFRTLSSQRAELLDAQRKAETEMLELEARLQQLHAPLQERIAAYEQRIEELEKELAAKGEENRELIGARITVARQHLSTERERGRFAAN